jgi:lipopolysaccharide assembly outer membrane protein LptD (OstA)
MLKIIWIDGKNSTIESIDSRLLNLDFESIHRRNLYSGNDFFLENNRIILGFEHHFINQVTGNESSVSVAKAFFSNKDFVRNQEKKLSSSIVSAFNLEITSNFEIKGSVEIDSDLEDMLAGSLSVKFNKGPKKNIEVRSVYKREVLDLDSYLWQDRYLPINQFEVISQWEISDNILLFSKVLRDAQSNASKDLTFGFEYSNCCLKAGLMKRKWIDQDYYSLVTNQSVGINHGLDNLHFEQERDNVYFFFELVELGRFGKEISEVLSSKYFQ